MEQPPNIPVLPAPQELLSHPEDTALETAAAFSHLLETGGISAAWQELAPLQPADQAQVLFALPQNLRAQLQAHLGPSALAALLDFLEPEDDLQLVENISSAQIAQVLDLTSPDVAADVLHLLPEDQGAQVLQEMRAAPLVQSLLLYPDDTAGGLMTLDFPVVSEDTNPALVLDRLRLLGPAAETIDSVLVVNADNRLVGSVGLVRLALARPTSPIRAIMDSPVPSVPVATDQEECARLMARYNLSRLPVVDDQGRLTGVILGEDILDVVQEEATEDMFRIAGVGEERVMGTLGRSLRSRTPWLLINLATAFLAALMISLFESTIARVVALAVFLPVVAGQGGIAGTQTVTLVVRGMALGEVPRQQGLKILGRELVLGAVHGLVLGVIVGLVALAWKGNPALGLVLGLAMLGNMLVAGLAGAGMPLLLRQLGQDPAVSSAVFVTTFTDVIGFLLFLGLAALAIGFLV